MLDIRGPRHAAGEAEEDADIGAERPPVEARRYEVDPTPGARGADHRQHDTPNNRLTSSHAKMTQGNSVSRGASDERDKGDEIQRIFLV